MKKHIALLLTLVATLFLSAGTARAAYVEPGSPEDPTTTTTVSKYGSGTALDYGYGTPSYSTEFTYKEPLTIIIERGSKIFMQTAFGFAAIAAAGFLMAESSRRNKK